MLRRTRRVALRRLRVSDPIETVDVVVVGLGPAGSRAAAAAARAGLRVVALERRREAGRPVQCAELVPLLLDQELPGLGAVTAQPIGRMQTFIEDAPPDETCPFPGRMLDRAAFDRHLAAEAAACGAECRFSTAVLAITREGDVLTSSGTLRPRVLIGADGPASRVGAAIGQTNHELVDARQVGVTLPADHDATDIFLAARYPGGYAWLFPKGGQANLGVGVDRSARGTLPELLAALQARLTAAGRIGAPVGALPGGATRVGGLLPAVGSLGAVQVLLAGDAAGLTHPVSGAGIAAAVQSGDRAGQAAAAWLGGHDAAPGDYADELADLFGASLARGLRRRRALREDAAGGAPSATALRRSWIAYSEYWAEDAP